MDRINKINSFDLRLFPLVVLPGFLSFLLLGLTADANKWMYGLMCLGGWYLASLIWWHLYQYFMINTSSASRLKFYVCCITVQLFLALIVLSFAGFISIEFNK